MAADDDDVLVQCILTLLLLLGSLFTTTKKIQEMSLPLVSNSVLVFIAFLVFITIQMDSVQTFSLVPTTLILPSSTTTTTTTTTTLFATNKKKSNKKKKQRPANFGGASMEPCPCSSGLTYSNCCGKIHKDVNTFKSASAGDLVRARYSAYAKKQPDFLMASTHPLHKDFNTDLKQWKETIKTNMYDNFDLPRCIIVNEEYHEEDQKANVTFIAELVLRESGEVTAFMETSNFERAKTHGGWLYLNGTIEEVPEELVAGLKKASEE